MTLFGLRANQETLLGRSLCNHLADLLFGCRRPYPGAPPTPARPLQSPRLCQEPADSLHFAPLRALGAVCGARRAKPRVGGQKQRTGEAERRETENARLAR